MTPFAAVNPSIKCLARGAYTSNNNTTGGRPACWWWLRLPGHLSDLAARVCDIGAVSDRGSRVRDISDAVRPALWIDLGVGD